MTTTKPLVLLGVTLEKTDSGDYSFHGVTTDRRARMLVGRIDWPKGTPTPWYAAVESIPGIHSSEECRSPSPCSWRFEGPFCATPEEAVAGFERAWDAARDADQRCIPKGPVVGS